jgi:hypothetical protein
MCAPGDDGIVPLAEDSRRRGGQHTDVPPGIGTPQALLARDQRAGHGCADIGISERRATEWLDG